MSTGLQATEDDAAKPEVRLNPEVKDSREKVLAYFNSAFDLFKSDLQNKPPDQVSEEELQTLQTIEGAFQTSEIRDGIDFQKRKFTYTNKITDPNGGPPIPQEEGIPVEGLIKYLRTKLMSLREDDPEKARIEEALTTLERNASENYDKAHPGQVVDINKISGETDHPVMFARKSQEAKLISNSSRATGSLEGDQEEDEEEAILPTATPSTASATPISSPPSSVVIPPAAPTSPTAPDSAAVSTESPTEGSPVTAGEYIWHAADGDIPVRVTGSLGVGEDGREYVSIEGSSSGIPRDQLNPAVAVEPAPTPEPEPTPASSPAPETKPKRVRRPSSRRDGQGRTEQEHFNIDIINAKEAADKKAHDLATKSITESIRKGRFYEFWHWPRKVGLRLIESGAINIQADRLTRAMAEHNTSFLNSDYTKAAAAQMNDWRAKGQTEQGQILERFKKDRILGREKRVEAQGAMKQAVIHELLSPIITGDISNQDQVREKLAAFVKKHLKDPDPAIRTQIESLFGPRASDFGNVADYFATDILETGLRLKDKWGKHTDNLAQYDQYIHINLGVAREAYNTDTRSFTDKKVAWARQRQSESLARGARYGVGFSGLILNPAVVGVSTALATQGVLRGMSWASKLTAIPGFITGGMFGAATAGARRYVELGRDRRTDLAEKAMGETSKTRAEIDAQIRNTRGLRGLFMRAPGAARVSGIYRRSDLAKFHYDWASVDQLLHGQGQEIVAGGGVRRSIDNLVANAAASQAEIGRRLAEIDTRLNRGQSKRVDWIHYTNRENINHEVSQLFDARDNLRAALRGAGLDNTAISALEANWTAQWNQALNQDRDDKDAGFRNYRRRNVTGAAIFGGVMGGVGGLLAQEGIAAARRIAGETNVGNTVLENIIHRKPPSEWTSGGEGSRICR